MAKKDKSKSKTDGVKAEVLAMQEEEERRARRELNLARLKSRQEREERYTAVNQVKIHNQWRKVMRLAKVDELRREVQIISQNHEREVDRKDSIIQMLDRDLEDAEEQYQMAHRAHLMVMDSLLDLQHNRMRALECELNVQLGALEEEFENERSDIMKSHGRKLKDLADMMNTMENEFGDKEADARQDFESQREEIKNRNSEEYNVLKISLESTIEELEKHFEQAHQAYLVSTEGRTQMFRDLTKSDEASARRIEKKMRKLIRLQDSLAHWRTKIATNSREWEERNRSLRREKDSMARHYQKLKASMNQFRAGQLQRLKALALHSGACIEELKEKQRVAECILKMAELNRKSETEQEKILGFETLNGLTPFASVREDLEMIEEEAREAIEVAEEQEAAMEAAAAKRPAGAQAEDEIGKPAAAIPSEPSSAADADAAEQAATTSGAEEAAEDEAVDGDKTAKFSSYGMDPKTRKAVDEWNYLNNFYKKFNKVQLDVAQLQHQRDTIQKENNQLRDVLKRYLDGISVNEDVISDDSNPLLVINDRMMKHQRQQQMHQSSAIQQESQIQAGAAQNILVVEQYVS